MTSYEVIKSWSEMIHIANLNHRKFVQEKYWFLYNQVFNSVRYDDANVEHDDPESCLELKDKIVEESCRMAFIFLHRWAITIRTGQLPSMRGPLSIFTSLQRPKGP